MYSRYSQKPESVQIPEHYSGCAFPNKKNKPTPQLSKSPPSFLEVGKPASPVPSSPPLPISDPTDASKATDSSDAPTQEVHHVPDPSPAESPSKAVMSPISKLFGNVGTAFPFSHGLGFEELLILGLIILLSRNEEDSDMILLLGLLLFCG